MLSTIFPAFLTLSSSKIFIFKEKTFLLTFSLLTVLNFQQKSFTVIMEIFKQKLVSWKTSKIHKFKSRTISQLRLNNRLVITKIAFIQCKKETRVKKLKLFSKKRTKSSFSIISSVNPPQRNWIIMVTKQLCLEEPNKAYCVNFKS